jgi:hypothetical protein
VPYASPYFVDHFVASRLYDPGSGRVRYAANAPLVKRRCKGFLRRLLGQFEILEMRYERRQDSAPFGPIDFLDRFVCLLQHAPQINFALLSIWSNGVRYWFRGET